MTDLSIQIATDYHKKYKLWTNDVNKYLSHAVSLYDKFQKGMLYLDDMSQVRAYLTSVA